MQAFVLQPSADPGSAATLAARPGACYIAGGTDVLQKLKNQVETPDALVDLRALALRDIHAEAGALHLGALATMADVAANPAVRRDWPMISEALLLSASPQVRNMGTMGGNLLQRTRCGYFRDTGFACNKRAPGSGCPAIAGASRELAILGGSDHCIATHPSDLPVALLALGAAVVLHGAEGARQVALADFYRLPGDTPQIETVLRPGELITAIRVPASAAARRARYVKLRDRASFAFALVAVAAALEVVEGQIVDARVAAGGVAPMPWRLAEVEAALRGRRLDDALLTQAAANAGAGARPTGENSFKVELLRRGVLRALRLVAA